MSELYDSAYRLEQAIRESEEYQELKQCYERLEGDETGQRMFENFRNLQLELQEKQMSGQEISEEEARQAERQFQLVQQHEGISRLIAAEQRMSTVIGDLNKIITKPLEELYEE